MSITLLGECSGDYNVLRIIHEGTTKPDKAVALYHRSDTNSVEVVGIRGKAAEAIKAARLRSTGAQ